MGDTSKLEPPVLASAYLSGTSAYALARMYGVSIWAIIERLRQEGVQMRPDGVEKTLDLTGRSQRVLRELIDGLLLGDGSIDAHKGFLRLEQSTARLGWVTDVQTTLQGIGVYCRIMPVKLKRQPGRIEGREIRQGPSILLYSCACREFRDERRRWYPRGKKRVPPDLKLTPTVAVHWLCGDGTASDSGGIEFCTDGFAKSDVDFLVERLSIDLGVAATRRSGRGSGQYRIQVARHDATVRLKNLVAERVPQCCQYKLRFVRPPENRVYVRKLTAPQVVSIYSLHKKGLSYGDLGRRFGVSAATVMRVVKGLYA